MMKNGDHTNFIKDIVRNVKKLLSGPVGLEQKDTSMQCSAKNVAPVRKNPSNTKFDFTLAFLFLTLVSSRFLEIPNFTPLLAIAIMLPYFTNNKTVQYLLPVSVLFLTDIIIGFYSLMFVVYANFIVSTLISTNLSKYFTAFTSVLIWHLTVNGAVYLANIGNASLIQTYIQAIPFDFKLLVSTLIYVAILDVLQKSISYTYQYNK